jgi:apolipoprotein N-acyltransferase
MRTKQWNEPAAAGPGSPASTVTAARVLQQDWLAATLAGAGVAAALPPIGLWPMLAGFAVLAHLLRGASSDWAAFRLGWSFGFGYFLAGLYWVAIAFFTDPDTFGPLGIPSVALLAAGLAVLPGLATLVVGRLKLTNPAALAFVLALAWTAAEVARGWIFPWNLIGYVWIDAPVAQLASAIGVYGLSLIAVALGALPVALLGRTRSWRPFAAGLIVLAVLWGVGAWRLGHHPSGSVIGVNLRLVQANVAQHHKWQPEMRARWFQRHIDLSQTGGTRPTLVIWPESATPYPIDRDPLVRQRLAQVAPQDGFLISGGERFGLDEVPPRAWNSLFVVDRSGRLVTFYDKHTLVPFGEYLPFRSVLGTLGIDKLAGGSVDFAPGPGPVVLEVAGVPPASPLICYEVIFPNRVVPDGRRPGWLLNITNDAWFGTSSGPYQHLAMARMRAIEEGLPLIRSANTGISAVIDPLGRLEATLGLNTMGTLDAALPRALEPTVFARYGNTGAVLLALLLACGAVALHRYASPASAKG